jgi:excisionase family DNA binding protein
MTAADSVEGVNAIETPSADEARESSARLETILRQVNGDTEVFVQSIHGRLPPVPIPLSILRLLGNILAELAQGHGVTLMPMHAELNSYEAARQLKVSRPFLLDLLEKGEIPCRKVGACYRIVFQDLIAYEQKVRESRAEALAKLSALGQELGLE